MKSAAVVAAVFAASLLLVGVLTQSTVSSERQIYNESADGRAQIKEGLKLAKESGKLLLITWGANWCGWCHHLEEQMSGSQEVQDLLREHYIAIFIDLGDRDKHMDLAREYGLEFNDLGIPYVTAHDATGKIVGKQSGKDRAVTLENGETVYSPELVAKFLQDCAKQNKEEKSSTR